MSIDALLKEADEFKSKKDQAQDACKKLIAAFGLVSSDLFDIPEPSGAEAASSSTVMVKDGVYFKPRGKAEKPAECKKEDGKYDKTTCEGAGWAEVTKTREQLTSMKKYTPS